MLTTQATCPSFIHTVPLYKQQPLIGPRSAGTNSAVHREEGTLGEKAPAGPGKDSGQFGMEF